MAFPNQCDANIPTTIPRKRRPRAVGEVFITSTASQVYLNSEFNENNEVIEPIYQNVVVQEHLRSRQCRGRQKHLSVARSTIYEVDESKESMIVSTYVG